MFNIDLFNSDERIYINEVCKNTVLSKLTLRKFIDNLDFVINISTDEMALSLAEGIKEKVSSISDEDWEDIKLKTPLPTFI